MTLQVSVIVPMRNAEAFVRATLDSLLAEQGVPLEVVVINDGSTDASAEVVRGVGDPRVRMIDGPCSGIAAALNAGIAEATGDVLMRCDSDDLFSPGRIAAQVEFLETHPEFVAVCGRFQTIDPRGELIQELLTSRDAAEITEELRAGETRTHFGTFAVRMALVRELGGARPYFIGTEDVDFQLRIGTAGRVWFQERMCYAYRLHNASSTHTQPTPQREFLTEKAREFARQRVATGTDDLEQNRAPEPPAQHAPAMDAADQIQGMLVSRSWSEVGRGQWGRGIRTAIRACRARPGAVTGWLNLAKVCVLPAFRRRGVTG